MKIHQDRSNNILQLLTVDSLLDTARKEVGLDDFGPMDFKDSLDILLRSFQQEANFTEAGAGMTYKNLIRRLTARLRYQDDLRTHPEILDEQVVSPIIILGLPRTGTSKLQRILSADPNSQRLEFWRAIFPAPLPNEKQGCPEGRIALAKEEEEAIARTFPDFMARHPMEATEPDEELHIMDMSFDSLLPWVFADMPTYFQHMDSCDGSRMYRELYGMLQYLQWQDGGARGRHWVLKTPVHLSNLSLLVRTFPDAKLVHCHRNPIDIIPSFASVISEARKIGCEAVDGLPEHKRT